MIRSWSSYSFDLAFSAISHNGSEVHSRTISAVLSSYNQAHAVEPGDPVTANGHWV